jgi:peptidyl-prolyl cis-trans isomerase B (cyclophilin B)
MSRALSCRAVRRLIAVLLLVAAAAIVGACGSDNGDENASTGPSGDITAPESTAAEGCKDVPEPKPKGEQNLSAPKEKLNPNKKYVAVVKTNCGTFEITLDVKNAPKTTASFAYLVREGFYNGLGFHRVVPGFVIQGGDPLGTGEGGPGYSVTEKPRSDTTYTEGTVAMAKTQLEDPGTSGSQFFVVTAPDAQLPPEYAKAGEVTKGMDVVQKIGAIPSDPQERPLAPAVMEKVTIKES